MGQQIDSLEVKIEANASSAANSIKNLTKNVQNLNSALKSNSAVDALDKVRARYEKIIGIVETYERRMADLRKTYENLGKGKNGLQGSAIKADLTALQMLVDKYSAKLDEIERKHPDIIPHIDTTAIEDAAKSEEKLAEGGEAAAKAQFNLRAALSSAWATLKKLASAISNVVSHLWKLISALNGAHKANDKSGLSFKKLTRFLIRYGLGMRSFFFLFRRLRRGMKEGFEHLGQYSEEAQMAIYGLKASVETLKNAFAAGFSNLLGPVVNFLQGFINAISSALNALGRLIAALGGKGFAIQAIQISADSMKELDSNTGSAASSAKKLEKALSVLPFDELNQLNGDKNSGGSGGGGGGGGANALSASQMFETIALNENDPLVSWGRRVREAFESENWTRLGSLLAEPINTGVSKIQSILDWKKNRPKIEAFTNGVTTTFNSLVKNVDWANIGLTISDAINDITGAVNGLVNGTDWRELGNSFGTAFNTLLENTDWAALGEMLFSKFHIIFQTAAGFIETANWPEIGTAFGNFIKGALKKINLPEVGMVLAELLNGAMDAAIAFIETGALGQAVSDFGDMIVAFASNTEWEKVGEVIGEGLASVDWAKFLGDMVNAFWKAFTGLLTGLLGSGGGGIAMLLGGGYLGSKLLKGLGGGTAGGGLLEGIKTFATKHPMIATVLGSLIVGKAANAERKANYRNMSSKQFQELTGISDKDLKKAGITRDKAYEMSYTATKKQLARLTELRQKWEDSPFGQIFRNAEIAASYIENSNSIPKAAQKVFQETQKVALNGLDITDAAKTKGAKVTRTTIQETTQ